MLKLDDNIANLLNLRSLNFPNTFDLIDESGELGVALSGWSQEPIGNDLKEETYKLKGLELVMRLDLYEALKRFFGTNLYQIKLKLN